VILKVISGGQTGADIAGVRAAKSLGIPTGGCTPFGWRTLSCPRPEYEAEFGMHQHPSPDYPPRTRENVKNSDITLRVAYNFLSRGEVCTLQAIRKLKKPVVDLPVIRRPFAGFEIVPAEIERVTVILRDFACATVMRQKEEDARFGDACKTGIVLNVAGNHGDERLEFVIEEALRTILKETNR